MDAIAAAASSLVEAAVAPLAANPELRERLVELRRQQEQMIDQLSQDELIDAGYSQDATDRARSTIESWEQFVEEHRDEITALQVLYSRPYRERLTFEQVKELAAAIEKPPHGWTPERLWQAYEALDRSRVRGGRQRVLTDLVSLVRFALHEDDELVAFPERVARALPGLAPPAGERRPRVHARAAPLAALDRGGGRDVARRLGRGLRLRAVRPARGVGGAVEGVRDELTPLLEELNEVLVA